MRRVIVSIAAICLLACAKAPEEVPASSDVFPSSIKLDRNELTLEKGANYVLAVTYTPSNSSNKTTTWVSSNTSIATVSDGIVVGVSAGSTEIIAKCGDAIDKCLVTVLDKLDVAIDVGMLITRTDGSTYKLLWAECNLGANSSTEYGDYYAWGEIEPYYSTLNPLVWNEGKASGYTWPSYKWSNGDETHLTKYCLSDNKAVLDPQDDAATSQLGGNWRMPTPLEFEELWSICTWTWTTRNGIKGFELVSKINNQIMFLPAAGSIYGAEFYSKDSCCQYWTSHLLCSPDGSERRSAFALYASSSNHVNKMSSEEYYDRVVGLSIRPVMEQ